ncbi:terpene synthase family protein [Streptomyces griseus]|uniref:terpene synthase family protein n=1 Tax=Streptomyces griseus TaxID=1911 RepID=UPI00369FD312
MANGCPPPPRLAEDRRVRAITEVAATLCDWHTDVISYDKEAERTGDGFNLIDAIRREHGCAEDEAVERAMIMWDRLMALFLRMRARLTAELPELAAFVNGLGQYIRGGLDWALGTDRYNYIDGVGGHRAFQPGGWRDTPRDNSPEPLPIPSIAWWWQHDPGIPASRHPHRPTSTGSPCPPAPPGSALRPTASFPSPRSRCRSTTPPAHSPP